MSDLLFSIVLRDLIEVEQITEAKIAAVIARQSTTLIQLLQQQIDPMFRLQSRTIELSELRDAQKAELKRHISRWSNRESYLSELLEKNLGYLAYMKDLLGVGHERTGLDLGL